MVSIRSLLPFPRLLQLSCIAALASGCFQDVETPSMMQPTCTAGEIGCECANGLCQDDLTCSLTAGKCVPDDCDPGTPACECDAGACDFALICTEGLCLPEGGGSGTDATSSTTNGPTTMTGPTTLTSSSTMTDPMTMTASMTDSTTTSTTDVDTTVADTTDDTSSTSTGEVDCKSFECAGCFECVVESVGPCEELETTCAGIPGCGTVHGCLTTCGTTGRCVENCCDGEDANVIDAAEAVFQCQSDNCISPQCQEIESTFCEP